MPIDLTPLCAEETEKAVQERLYTLVAVTPPSGSAELPIYVVDNNTSVVYQGITYIPFPVKLQGINTTTDGSVDKTSVTIGNVDSEGLIMGYIARNNGMSKWTVRFVFVYEKFLDGKPDVDVDAYTEEFFLIDTYTATEQYVTFTLEPVINLGIQLPRRRFMTDSCFWRFKDITTCKYVSHGIGCVIANGKVVVIGVGISGWINESILITNGGNSATATITAIDTVTTPGYTNLTITPVPAWFSYLLIVSWSFKSCPKTLDGCKLRGNHLNFGGFPGVTGTRRLYV